LENEREKAVMEGLRELAEEGEIVQVRDGCILMAGYWIHKM